MTAITFPNSPSSGDTHTAGNGIVYTYDGEKWTSIGTNSAGTWTRSGTEVSLTNAGDDLNVDSGTLFVDASTDRVGVGTSSPATTLDVNGDVTITDKIIHGGDTNTAIRFPAADTFAVETDGTERLRVDSAGNVGIGTTSPQSKASFLTTSVPASSPTWSDSWVSIGPNVGSSTGAALGLGYDSSGDEGYFMSVAPGIAFKPLNIQASVIKFQAGSSGEDARIDSSGRLLVGTSSSSGSSIASTALLQVQGRAGFASDYAVANLRAGYTPSGADAALGFLTFSDSSNNIGAWITAYSDGGGWTSGSNHRSRLMFSTTADGASSPTERMRITNNGIIYIGATGQSGGGAPIPNDSGVSIDQYGTFRTRIVSNGNYQYEFANASASVVGYIQVNSGSVTYSTTSDYRLKENLQPLAGATERIKQLSVYRFNFISDPDTQVDGFVAHEVQAVVPEAISGVKDAVHEDGSINPQGIDQSKLVPLLTAALQEALTEIESLKARVTALEP